MKLSIIILNFNTKDLTLSCVKSIIKNTKNLDYEIIVVDNGSSEIFPKSRNYKLIINKSNLGFAGGNNRAREFCKGNLVLFLNSDTLINKNSLNETVNFISKHPEVG